MALDVRFGRVEILAAQINGLTLLLFDLDRVRGDSQVSSSRLEVDAAVVAVVAAVGIVVNLVVALLSRARRQSLNVRGAYLHIVTDLAAFIGTGSRPS